jgi:hypothetical protein
MAGSLALLERGPEFHRTPISIHTVLVTSALVHSLCFASYSLQIFTRSLKTEQLHAEGAFCGGLDLTAFAGGIYPEKTANPMTPYILQNGGGGGCAKPVKS